MNVPEEAQRSPPSQQQQPPPQQDESALVAARREKLQRWREELGVSGYGGRVEGLISLAEARALFNEQAHEAYHAANQEAKDQPGAAIEDARPRARVAGRCIQHRPMGKLVFLVLRDHSGDLQISVSKSSVDAATFTLASKLDYGDIVVAEGPVGKTQKGEICVWADRFELACKSLVPPPEKFHGLVDAELRYRHRYIDMYANPDTMATFQERSRIVSSIRRFMEERGFLEVETPMMQPQAGGAAARPFVTHHNVLDIDLSMRIAPELYLKRLLVGGMPRVYEINRNFRNEGVDRSHNPEFTSMEVYEAFGDCWSMLELTESLLFELARETASDGKLPFGELTIDWSRPFARVRYDEMFRRIFSFEMTDERAVRERAKQERIENWERLDHWLLVNELYERHCEPALDATRPTFVTDYPSAISPLTRPQEGGEGAEGGAAHLCHRWELLVAGMELGTAYSELNDPEIQRAKFTEQLAGGDEEVTTFRTLDEDFLHALAVGMPPAGGLGLGVDRIVMLLTNRQSIRDVILFPLLKPQ